MTVEPNARNRGDSQEAPAINQPRDVPRHVDVIGAEASRTSPLRWALVLLPLMLAILGGVYLLGVWVVSLQRAAGERHAEAQRPVLPQESARRPPTESSGVDAREISFDVAIVLGLLAKADPAQGAFVFKMCAACHTDDRTGPHKVGPNLWGIVGYPKAALPGFAYSQALRAKGGVWSYRELALYMHNPRTSVPGTSMAFAGITSNERMANLIAYMRTRADKPAQLPR